MADRKWPFLGTGISVLAVRRVDSEIPVPQEVGLARNPRIALRFIRGYLSVTPDGVPMGYSDLARVAASQAKRRLALLNP